MAKSFGGALKEGCPIVMTYKDNAKPTEIWYREGDEKRALELLVLKGIVQKVILPNKPAN